MGPDRGNDVTRASPALRAARRGFRGNDATYATLTVHVAPAGARRALARRMQRRIRRISRYHAGRRAIRRDVGKWSCSVSAATPGTEPDADSDDPAFVYGERRDLCGLHHLRAG